MRTIDLGLLDASLLVDDTVRCDYVYAYPPRQAYRPLEPGFDTGQTIRAGITRDPRLNLYVHFPFCSQVCSFCNLYATVPGRSEAFEGYVELLETEIEMRAPLLAGSVVRSVYFGGGTPSLLSAELLERVLLALQKKLGFRLSDIDEVAIEVAPDTATTKHLAGLRSIGLNRVNLGLQTTSATELHSIGRRYEVPMNERAVEAALGTGFDNVCVDLIYGLPGQDDDAWLASLNWVADRRPETVCAYPLTVRAGTRYGMTGHEVDPRRQYLRYDTADRILRENGYLQETHVRWVLPGRGGYKQKQYHWACENLIGFGAGARSYLWGADLRNGYSLRPRKAALRQYEQRIREGLDPVVDGFVMDDDERMRKMAILGLADLDGDLFHEVHGQRFDDVFASELATLTGLRLVENRGNGFALTEKGIRHRDVIVQMFFSGRVLGLVRDYDYDA